MQGDIVYKRGWEAKAPQEIIDKKSIILQVPPWKHLPLL